MALNTKIVRPTSHSHTGSTAWSNTTNAYDSDDTSYASYGPNGSATTLDMYGQEHGLGTNDEIFCVKLVVKLSTDGVSSNEVSTRMSPDGSTYYTYLGGYGFDQGASISSPVTHTFNVVARPGPSDDEVWDKASFNANYLRIQFAAPQPPLEDTVTIRVYDVYYEITYYDTTTTSIATIYSTASLDGDVRCNDGDGLGDVVDSSSANRWVGFDWTSLKEKYKGFDSFSNTTVSGTVLDATLEWSIDATFRDGTGTVADLPNIASPCYVDHLNYGASLDTTDYELSAITSQMAEYLPQFWHGEDYRIVLNTRWVGVKTGVGTAVQADLDATRTTSQFRLWYDSTAMDSAASSDNYIAPLTTDYSTADPEIYHPRLRVAYTTDTIGTLRTDYFAPTFTTPGLGPKTHTIDAIIKEIKTTTHTVDAIITETKTATHTADAIIKETKTATHTVDAQIWEPPFPVTDNFDDNSLNTEYWVKPTSVWNNAAEQNQQLELISTASGSAIIRTRGRFLLAGKYFQTKVTNHSTDGGFKISSTYGTANWPQWDVYSESDWYNFQSYTGNVVRATKKKAGGSVVTLATTPVLSAPYWLRMWVDSSDNIYFEYSSDGESWKTLYKEAWDLAKPLATTEFWFWLTAYNTPTTGAKHADDYTFDYEFSRTAHTHTADAVIVEEGNTYTKTHTADAIIQETLIQTNTVDAIIEETGFSTPTADAIILATSTETHTVDAIISETSVYSHTADGIIKETSAETHTADAIILETSVHTVTVDGIIEETLIQTNTVDALIQGAGEHTITADGIILETISSTHTIDAIIVATQTATHTVDAIIQVTETETHTVDAIVEATTTATHTINAIVQETFDHTITVDGIVEETSVETITIDGIVKETLIHTHTADALIEGAGEHTITADGIILETIVATHTLDAIIVAAQAASHTIDAIVQVIDVATHTINAIVKETSVHTHTVDALIEGAGEKTHTMDAIVLETSVHSHTVDAIVQITEDTTHTIDAIVKESFVETHTADGIIQETLIHTHTVDAVIEAAGQATHTVDAIVLDTTVKTNTVDAIIAIRNVHTHTVDAIIKETIVLPIGEPWGVKYDANEFPQNATPSWTRSNDNAPEIEEIVSGELHIKTQYWIYYDRGDGEFDNSTGWTAEMTLRIVNSENQGNIALGIDDDARWAEINFYEDRVVLRGDYIEESEQSYYLDATVNHDYRMTVLGDTVKVYVDGILRMSGTLTYEGATDTGLWFGSFSGTGTPEYYIDNVYYRVDGAYEPYPTADAIVVSRPAHSHTADAIVFATSVHTHTADGFVEGAGEKTYTIDAIIFATSTATNTADGIIQESKVATHTADAIVQETSVETHTADGIIQETLIHTHTVDAVIEAAGQSTHTADGIVLATTTATHTVDAIISVVGTTTHTIDAIIQEAFVTTHTADGIIKETLIHTHTVDALIEAAGETTHTADAIIEETIVETHTVDAIVSVTGTTTHTVDAIIKETITTTHTVDAIVLETSVHTVTADAIIKQVGTHSHTIDAVIVGIAYVHTHTADGRIIDSRNYTKEAVVALPGNADDLSTAYTVTEYGDVATSNDVRVAQEGTGLYVIHQYKNLGSVDTNNVEVQWEGKSDLAPSESTMYLQIYNFDTTTWETLDSDNTTAADTDFTLSGSITSSQSDYYDSNLWIACRVYQYSGA